MTMNKLLAATAIAASLWGSGAAFADYSDKSEYTCDKDTIKDEMDDMIARGPDGRRGISIIYIKGEPVETSRKPNELRCRITVVLNTGLTQTGIFRFHEQDGHALVGWQGGAKK
jgi:hypothetical protein